MKTNQISFLIITVITLLSGLGCKKYPDGPLISLRSKTERVANNWKIGQALDNGHDVTSDYNRYQLNLTKSGSASLSAKYKFLGIDYEYVTTGTWAFVSNNEKISFDFDNNDADAVYQILRLKEVEMWLKKDGGTLEFHFVPQ
jgi:hypothetical protein